jgi:hypothetical protein
MAYKKFVIFSGHFDGKTLGNQRKTIQKHPQNQSKKSPFLTYFFRPHLSTKVKASVGLTTLDRVALAPADCGHKQLRTWDTSFMNLLLRREGFMLIKTVRKFLWIITGFWLCGLLVAANAQTYQMSDGTSVSGEIISFNDDGVIFHTPDDRYTDRIPWTKFSQDALKTLAKNPKMQDYAEPFIETPPPAPPKLEFHIRDVSRLALPPKQSVIGALFSSSLGIVLLLLIYATNLYAGFEVAIFRARPIALVIGLAALLPILGPIIFLSMPTQVEPGATEEDMQMETGAPPEAIAPPPSATASTAQPTTTESVHAESVHLAPAGWQAAAAVPETQVFQRGQFTFNRRFFETKFSGYFGMSRHGADKDMLLVVKTPRAQHIVQRISRISSNEAYFEVMVGAAHQEVMVPFAEIQEIQLKHKDA